MEHAKRLAELQGKPPPGPPIRYKPLLEGSYEDALAEWHEEKEKWARRECEYTDESAYDEYTYEEYYGEAPEPDQYMPSWSEEEKTHLMMYENTSEGTPISPAFETPEELARWLADNGASSFGDMTATYEQWLSVCQGGWAPSAVIDNGILKSGVEALADK
jgi:hypothetical protein